jgi:hypothetical protein
MFITVGNEEADPAVAEVVSIDERSILLVPCFKEPLTRIGLAFARD